MKINQSLLLKMKQKNINMDVDKFVKKEKLLTEAN